jgi:hypothetical protein
MLITAAEWRWVIACSSAVVALTCLPLLVAALNAPSGSRFSGFVYVARDGYVYVAAMQQGMRGSWLFLPPYTSELLRGVLLYPLYLGAGHVVGALQMAPVLAFHLMRLTFGLWLLLATYALAARCFRAVRLRRLAWVLATLGGGIGPLVGTQLQVGPVALRPMEMLVSGSTVIDSLNLAPHVALAEALFVTALLLGMALPAGAGWRWPLLAGVLLALATIYPPMVVLAALVLATVQALRRDSLGMGLVTLAAATTVPYGLYTLWLLNLEPSPLAVTGLHFDVGDPAGFFLLAHTIPFALLALGLWRWRGRWPARMALPLAWVVWATVLLFGPWSPWLGRSFYALSIPFGLLATWGVGSLSRVVRGRRWKALAIRTTVSFACLFAVFTLAQGFWIASNRLDAQAMYVPQDLAAALAYVGARAEPQDVVLGSYFSGLFVPAYAGCRTFVGHPDQTLDVRAKDRAAQGFYLDADPALQALFLRDQGIRFVLWGPNERGYGGVAPEVPDLKLTFQASSVRVYENVAGGMPAARAAGGRTR